MDTAMLATKGEKNKQKVLPFIPRRQSNTRFFIYALDKVWVEVRVAQKWGFQWPNIIQALTYHRKQRKVKTVPIIVPYFPNLPSLLSSVAPLLFFITKPY